MYRLLLEHDKGSGAINRVCKFPVVKSDMFHDENDPAVIVNDFFNGNIETITINPLVRAIQLRAHKVSHFCVGFLTRGERKNDSFR